MTDSSDDNLRQRPDRPQSWRDLRKFDSIEETEIRDFEKLQTKSGFVHKTWTLFKDNPILFFGLGGAFYCLCAGMHAMNSGREWITIRYLEGRIYAQGTAMFSIFGGIWYYHRKFHRETLENNRSDRTRQVMAQAISEVGTRI